MVFRKSRAALVCGGGGGVVDERWGGYRSGREAGRGREEQGEARCGVGSVEELGAAGDKGADLETGRWTEEEEGGGGE